MSVSRNSEPASEAGGGRVGRTLAIGFGVVVIGLSVAFIFLGPHRAPFEKASLELENWRVTQAELTTQAEADRERTAALEPGEREARVEAALVAFDEAELRAGGDLSAVSLRKAQAELKETLNRYVNDHGLPRYHALGLYLRARFTEALSGLLAAIRESGERASVYLLRHPLAPESRLFRRYCGAFLGHALSSGLITEDGHLQDGAEHVPGLFFLVRWFFWIHPTTDYTFQLSAFELEAFWSWKVEASTSLPLERRFELVRQLERLDVGYPADLVRGILYARTGRWEKAAIHWQTWLERHPDDETAYRNLRYADTLLRARQEARQER